MLARSSDFVARRADWSSRDLLSGLQADDFTADCRAQNHDVDAWWKMALSEYDAVHFSRYLRQSGLSLSSDFQTLEKSWARDEANHFQGASCLMSKLFAIPQSQIEARAHATQPEFAPIEDLIPDEFSICVIMMYSEIASVRGYSETAQLAESWGPPCVSRFFKNLARDEMFHYLNAKEVILRNHAARTAEIPALLETVTRRTFGDDFRAPHTFLLSYGPEPASEHEFLRSCISYVVAQCER